MYKIIFNDGNIEILVATDMPTYEECVGIINKQENPEFYKIIKM